MEFTFIDRIILFWYNIVGVVYMAFIYIIKNKINNKVYIGQTTRSLEWRFLHHKGQINCKNQCSALYSAFKKYGVENFWIESIEEGNFSHEELNKKEIYYIKKYNSVSPNGYNLQLGGDCSGVSLETRKKISEKMKGRKIEWRKEISNTMKEVWENEEYRKHMSEAHSKPRGKYKKHIKPLRLNLPIDEINAMYKKGMNINKIAKKYNVPYSTIKRRIKIAENGS